MATEFVIDADEGIDASEEEAPPVTVKLGGRVYTAYCPKDVVWMQIAAMSRDRASVAEQAGVVFGFLDAAFDPETVDALERRFRDRGDPLGVNHLMAALDKIVEHYRPVMQARFERLGLEYDQPARDDAVDDGDGASAGNRRTRRATAAASRSRGTGA
ncbi:MAG: hypothetical protein J2P26_12800 [Nocardiopsaceae bacterium]|nr:hypothetical protein [Nocardiopsaceae bacterium]